MRNKYLKNVFRIYSFYLVSNHLECMLYLLLCYINFLCHSCFGILTKFNNIRKLWKAKKQRFNIWGNMKYSYKIMMISTIFLSNYLSVNLYMFIIYIDIQIYVYIDVYTYYVLYTFYVYIYHMLYVYIYYKYINIDSTSLI